MLLLPAGMKSIPATGFVRKQQSTGYWILPGDRFSRHRLFRNMYLAIVWLPQQQRISWALFLEHLSNILMILRWNLNCRNASLNHSRMQLMKHLSQDFMGVFISAMPLTMVFKWESRLEYGLSANCRVISIWLMLRKEMANSNQMPPGRAGKLDAKILPDLVIISAG